MSYNTYPYSQDPYYQGNHIPVTSQQGSSTSSSHPRGSLINVAHTQDGYGSIQGNPPLVTYPQGSYVAVQGSVPQSAYQQPGYVSASYPQGSAPLITYPQGTYAPISYPQSNNASILYPQGTIIREGPVQVIYEQPKVTLISYPLATPIPYTLPQVNIVIGPVIGLVTHNSARVLFEFDRDGEVKWHINAFGIQEWQSGTVKTRPKIPIVLTFNNLKPATEYKLTIDCNSRTGLQGTFKTMRAPGDKPGNLKAAIVSCNEISYQEEKRKNGTDLWAHLRQRIKSGEIEYVFHIGDQAYMDMQAKGQSVWVKVRDILDDTPQVYWETEKVKNQVLEIIRDRYRETWGDPSVAKVLASVPNLTICDDHEFRDDWGFKDEHSTPGTLEHYYGLLCRQVYYEYQRQLREDIDGSEPKREYYYYILNGVAVVFSEYRGCRTWYRDEEDPETFNRTHFGQKQVNWIRGIFEQGGELDAHGINACLFITPVPFFVINHFLAKFSSHFGDDFNDIKDSFMFDGVPQLVEFLDWFRAWKSRYEGRELLIVAGDVHVGGRTDIIYDGDVVLRQFVSSAVNGEELTKTKKGIMSFLQHFNKIKHPYRFKQHDWIRFNNYGVVRVHNEGKGVSITDELVRYEH